MSSAAPEVLDPVALAGLVLPSDRYRVESALQSQEVSANDRVYDVLEIGFSVTGRPGIFHASIPLMSFRIFESGIDLTSAAAIIEAIYETDV